MLTTRLIPLALVLLLVGGCSESGSSGNTFGQPPFSDTESASGSLNGNLTGEIWVSSAPAKRFNLQTGQLVDVSEGEAFPSRDGTEFVEHLEDYDFRLDTECFNTPIDIHKISVKKSLTGELTSSFLIERLINGPIRLSPDGSRIAMKVAALGSCGSNNRDQFMSVYSVDGSQLFRGNESMQTFDWFPDGRLVILSKIAEFQYQLDFETAPNSLEFITAADFTLTEQGVQRVSGLRVSPRGNFFFSFEGVTGQSQFLSGVSYRNAQIFTLNLDGEGVLNSLFVSGGGDGESRVNTPVFSPDGESLLVTENYSEGAFSTFFTDHQFTDTITSIETVPVPQQSVSYVVPTSTVEQTLPPSNFSGNAFPIFISGSGGISPTGFNPRLDQTWTPTVR